MEQLSRKVWLVTLASVVAFAIYETIKTLVLPRITLFWSHGITVAVVGILSFFISRYVFGRYERAVARIERQTLATNETNRLLSAVLASLQEGVVIVNSNLDIILYNKAATQMIRVPADNPASALSPSAGFLSAGAKPPVGTPESSAEPDLVRSEL